MARGRCADVFLGFALSEPLRRSGRPALPEPLDLPVAACRIRDAAEPATPLRGSGDARGSGGHGYRIGAWQATSSAAEYATLVATAREAIAAGEVYQVNLVQHLAAPFEGDPEAVPEALRTFAPLHGRAFRGDGWSCRLRLAGTVPGAARSAHPDDADQGNAPARPWR